VDATKCTAILLERKDERPMLDQGRLSAAREALGMEKRAAPIAAAAKAVKPAAKAGLLGLKRLLALIGATGGVAGGYMLGRDAGGTAKNIEGAQTLAKDESEFDPQEMQQFARHGIDPARLKFLSTLSQLRQGMNLNKQMTEDAMRGSLAGGSPAAPGAELGEYA